MNICSVVVHARPERINQVASNLAELPGVEIHGTSEADGKFIVTVEDEGEASAADTMMSFNSVDGVISATLIYHYGGDDLDQEVIHEIN